MSLCNLLVGSQAYRTHTDEMAQPVFVALFGIGVWTGSQGLLILVNNPVLAFVFHLEIYVGAVIGATGVAHVALVQANRTTWLTPSRLGILYGSIGVWCLLFLTNSVHEWLYVSQSYAGELVPVLSVLNPLYWVYLAHDWLLSAVGLGLLANEYRRATNGSVYEKQAGTMALAILIPFAPNILAYGGVTTHNYSVWGFGATGLLTAAALYRYRWMDLVPVARDTVIEQMQEGYLVLDSERRVIDLNETTRSLLSGTNLIGTDIESVCPGCLPLLTGKETKQQLQFGGTVVTATASEIETPRGPGHMVLFRDITDQERVERRFQALIENIPDNILIVDADGQVTYSNSSLASETITGPEITAARNLLNVVHPDDYPDAAHTFAHLAQTPGRKEQFEFRILYDDGTVRVYDSVGLNLLDDPLVDGIVIVFRDVTQRKAREQQLRATKEDLEASNQKLEQFAGVVSHDLRNPLSVASGHLELARKTGNAEHFDKAATAHERMERLITDLLTLAGDGETVGERMPVRLPNIVRTSWETAGSPAGTLTVETERTVLADRERLRQLFENLFRNAVEHGGASVELTVGNCDGGFYIADTGPGIPAEQRDEVFQYGHSEREDGTGLGLAIVAEIVAAHGWDITIADSTTGGARFEITGVEFAAE